jgi:hypothetical protein
MKKIIISLLVFISFWITTNAYFLESLNAANYLANLWIIVKKNNAKDYNLDKFVLRQEVAAVARWVAWINKKSICENEFKDITSYNPNNWICYTAEALRDAWIIAKNNYFNPEKKVTKAEALWMMVKAAWFDYNYDPSKNSSWQKQLVDYATYKWIISNFTNYNSLATRWWVFEAWEKSLKIIKNWKVNSDWNVDIDTDVEDILKELFSE